MRELNVLSIAYYSFISLPQTTQLLKNLRTLHLHECESLETISVVGELENLEILICHYCHSIKELPIEMGRLRRLRLLEISDCSRLKKIAPGVISNLDKLEELKIVDSFVKWEAGDKNNEGKGRKNAGLRELERLSSLTCLEIQIEDSTLVAENISLPPNIVKFDIQFGKTRYIRQGFDKILALDLPREISTGDWINMQLLRKTECLISIGSGSENLDLAEAENIRSLTLDDCQTMTKLVNTTSSLGATTVFPRLESLRLFDLPQLQDLCNINRADVISNLSSIVVCDCHSLHNLFSLTTAKDCLSQLKSLTIRTCDMMEQVLLWNENQKVDIVESGSRRRHITFPKLKTLWLWELPNLTTFCQGIESIEFPLLLVLEIRGCSKLKSLVSTVSSTESGNDQNNSGGIGHHDDCLHWFCEPQKVTFGSLKELNIREDDNISRLWCQQIPFNFFTGLEMLYLYQCGNITSLFSFSVATKLVNLKKVEILDCGKMVRVIEDDKEKDSCQSTVSLFPNLKILRLVWLLELKSFCEWRCALKFSSLEILEINGCPQMERFSLGSLITPCLKEISINEGRYIEEDRRQIMSCLEQVLLLLNEEENENAIGQSRGGGRIAAFPGLEKLKLCDLPNLTTFCKGIFESIKFPMLTEMEIKRCPNLKNLVSTTSSSSGGVNHGDDGDDGDFLHLFCEPKGAFGRLKKLLIEGYINTLRLWCCQIPIHFFMGLERLSISDCGNIRSLFSSSIAGNLHNLRHLVIYGCGEMVKVIEDDKGNDAACGGQTTISLFPEMQRLNLQLLSKLEIFCEWRSSCALVLPSLKTVKIVDCPKMRRFSLGSLTTPNLNKIYTDNKCILETEDLNVVLQQNFIRAKEEEEEKEEEEQEENDHHQERRGKIIEEEEN